MNGDDQSYNFCYSTLSSSTSSVTLDAIMEQLQQMHADFGGRLDYLIVEMCQMNTRIGCIAS